MNIFRIAAVAILVAGLGGPALADDYTNGIHFQMLSTPQPTNDSKTVEVVELFWYGCPHCYELEADIAQWLDKKPADVSFVRMPAIPTARWEWHAKVYFAAEVLGVLDKIHKPLFSAIHKDKRSLKTEEEMAKFFAEHGVSEKDFYDAIKSFAVVTKVNRAQQMTRRYGITSVPTMIVNGKFRTTGTLAGSHGNMFKVVDFLVDEERPTLQSAVTAE